MTPTTQGWVFLCLPAQGKSGTHGLTLASRVPFPASLHHEPLCCVRAHGMCCRMHWEGVAVTFDPEVTTPPTVIEHHLRSFRHLSEAFFAVLSRDLQLCDAEWKALEQAILTVQDAVHAKVVHLLDAFNALRWQDAVTAPEVDPRRCPLCGAENACGMAGGAGTCWCFTTSIPPKVLERVPAEARKRVCVCRACATDCRGSKALSARRAGQPEG
jgi:Cysteine-rich CWC